MDTVALIQAHPKIGIIVLSLIVTLVTTIISYLVTDKEFMKRVKEKQKTLREEMKKYKDNPEKMMEINKKMMEDMPQQMKQSMKIMVITIVPLLVFFSWLRNIYSTTAIAGSWIWWYIGFSIIFSILLRKIFRMD